MRTCPKCGELHGRVVPLCVTCTEAKRIEDSQRRRNASMKAARTRKRMQAQRNLTSA